MTACATTGPFGVGTLVCTLPSGHVNGHAYQSTSGYDADEVQDD